MQVGTMATTRTRGGAAGRGCGAAVLTRGAAQQLDALSTKGIGEGSLNLLCRRV
jgi:hypothetical protein